MPELPEVETVKNYLSPLIKGKEFNAIDVLNDKLRVKVPKNLVNHVTNSNIEKITRRAKYLLIYLKNDQVLIIHLGMTGKIFVEKKLKNEKHDHVIFCLNNGDFMRYNDVRKFGLVTCLNKNKLANSKFFSHLGIEPLSDDFTGKYLKEICKNSNTEIKKFIMEQKKLVGVGNIYASEALFSSKIHPETPSRSLSLNEANSLVKNIKSILIQAIAKGGSTIKDYRLVNGESGYFQHEFKVYGRENNPCKICATPIKKIVQAGRSTFYCIKCQKK